MTEPHDLRALVGEDAPAEELEALAGIDRLLRSVPPPPAAIPDSLTRAVLATGSARRRVARPPLAGALALAAAFAAFFFGLGLWTGGRDSFEPRLTVPMEATARAPGASAVIEVSEREESGNWRLRLEVSGLPKLPEGGYYVLWLEKDGEYGGTCGTFRTAEGEPTTVTMNASYRLADFDAWVVTPHLPGDPPDADPPRLLEAPIEA